MGSGRKYNKTPRTRPKKNTSDKRRREKVQRARLVALGMGEEAVDKLNPKEVRTLLKRPAKVANA